MSFSELGKHVQQENLESLVCMFLFYQQHPGFARKPPLSACPSVKFAEDISVFHSAKALFYTPSDPSGVCGLYCEMIQCTPKWKTGGVVVPQKDCIVLNAGSDIADGARGLNVA